jgi:hypothetical protein
MRSLAALVLAAAGCAAVGPGRGPAIRIGEDGRTVEAGGETWTAPEGVSFFGRGNALHVVSLVPGQVFDVRVPLDGEGRLAPPADAPFEVVAGALRLRGREATATVAALVESGQIYRHGDHFHLTHRFENGDWQALYRAREEGSALPPAGRYVAAMVLAALVDVRIPGRGEEETARALGRVAAVAARARRSLEGGLPAKQITGMVLHDFEIGSDGRTLAVEGRTYEAAGDVRFGYCGDHFHVESPPAGWSHPVLLHDLEFGRFEFPPSVFFEVRGAAVAERDGRWRTLLASRQIRMAGDAWYVSEEYRSASLAALRDAEGDVALPARVREAARAGVVAALSVRLDVASEEGFRARLAEVDRLADARWREIEGQVARPRRRR